MKNRIILLLSMIVSILALFTGIIYYIKENKLSEFANPRFYFRMNPVSSTGSWIQVTPASFTMDYSYSYWYDVSAKPVTRGCNMLENRENYLKLNCSGEIIEFWLQKADEYYPCAIDIKFRGYGIEGLYWIPDGSRQDHNYDNSKPYSYSNNNAYKNCIRLSGESLD